ncbi:MAG TPA: hypothetical protein VH138_18635, partial [Vicinamibacterales bacterium]|nr:hypothetical protein [Vicinamibacterales bacterium]
MASARDDRQTVERIQLRAETPAERLVGDGEHQFVSTGAERQPIPSLYEIARRTVCSTRLSIPNARVMSCPSGAALGRAH